MESIDKNLMRVFKEVEEYEKLMRSMKAKVNFGWISKEEYEEWRDMGSMEDEEYE